MSEEHHLVIMNQHCLSTPCLLAVCVECMVMGNYLLLTVVLLLDVRVLQCIVGVQSEYLALCTYTQGGTVMKPASL